MPISPDIRRAIEIVDQRIQSLQKIVDSEPYRLALRIWKGYQKSHGFSS